MTFTNKKSRMRLKTGIIIILVFSFLNSFAQVATKKSETKISIGGKPFYIHVVQKGETLYGLSNTYEVNEESLISSNPGIDHQLIEGSTIKIPIGQKKKKFKNTDPGYIKHVTLPGETIYSISNLYNIPQDIIFQTNKIKNGKLKAGTVLKIPRTIEKPEGIMVEEIETTTIHKVKKNENLISISKKYNIPLMNIYRNNKNIIMGGLQEGQYINIVFNDTILATSETSYSDTLDSIKQTNYYFDLFTGKNKLSPDLIKFSEYKPLEKPVIFTILLPFNHQLINDLKSKIDTGKVKEDIAKAKNDLRKAKISSDFYLDFYHGALLAIDSLKKSGVNIAINIYDTQSDSNIVRYFINKHDLKKSDILIAPPDIPSLNTILSYMGNTQTKIIVPIGKSSNFEHYHNVYQVIPNEEVYREHLTYYLAKNSHKNIILLAPDNKSARNETYEVKNHILRYLEYSGIVDSSVVKEVYYKDSVILEHSLSKEKENIIALLSSEEAFIANIVRELFYINGDYNISIVGNPSWSRILAKNTINIEYLHKLNITYFTPLIMDYSNKNTIAFLKNFRVNYRSEPPFNDAYGTNPTLFGYDVCFYFLNAYIKGRTEPYSDLIDFDFIQKNEHSYHENIAVKFIKYNNNFDINIFKTLDPVSGIKTLNANTN